MKLMPCSHATRCHAARIHDRHRCPEDDHVGGTLQEACATVLIEGAPATRIVDRGRCRKGGPVDFVVRGARRVLIQGRPAARTGDPMAHGGAIVTGARHVLIGDYDKRPRPPAFEDHALAFELTGTDKDVHKAAFVYTEQDEG